MKILLKTIFYIATSIFLLFVTAVLLVVYLNKKINEPYRAYSKEQIFEVETGEGARDIAMGLQNAKLISDKNYFLFYLWQSGKSSKLQAGKYSFGVLQTIKEIADKIIKGEATKDEIAITIPEGFRLSEIDSRLAQDNIIKKGELSLRDNLEGYMFPDTYNFSTVNLPLATEDVIKKFLDNFDKKTNDLRAETQKRDIDFKGIVIIASILEKEVKTPEDMKIVAGILLKRITIGMPLQVDATIAYITGKKTGEITYDDLKIKSPYNTYTNKGLPPSPISNPGLIALDAALNLAQSDYLYYLSKPSGETVFSKTLEEHNKAKNLYLK